MILHEQKMESSRAKAPIILSTHQPKRP
jgi:hypothetical protein